ncbi:type I-F CRISPR-associated endoribonuclease Cas6/Csy4 [Agaribacter marinus]|uniref:Type I-F CRISPR-associated endoribonuclease Cas6/Csy4 n=1 Tax=Agaribacter marinus TaxID=1431249 RepID=A0AA37T2D4_9ALTE|nr:type I-F CRISPR-associated endoribonuclease Cas6/Csy4 [Agaribacter marinus]GLR72735.1 type I-F CRISPR-associated endoribonuclease Cas6/Csy4 [Agaribacter marinus]
MDYYIDLILKPDAEMREAELSSKVFTKFHKALVNLNTNQIGISFPLVNLKLGNLFRIHGEQSLLNDLQGQAWLGGLSEYCKMSEILKIPEKVNYRIVSQKRSNMSNAKLKRLIARGNIDEAGIKNYKIKMLSQGFDNPYLDMFSGSTQQNRRIFIEFSEILTKPTQGIFDSFGLSKTATIPWF